eukprot:7073398-Alexandrium_andersonii.AAC.1
MSASLVGSEMCIRDSPRSRDPRPPPPLPAVARGLPGAGGAPPRRGTVSYTHLTLPTICSV